MIRDICLDKTTKKYGIVFFHAQSSIKLCLCPHEVCAKHGRAVRTACKPMVILIKGTVQYVTSGENKLENNSVEKKDSDKKNKNLSLSLQTHSLLEKLAKDNKLTDSELVTKALEAFENSTGKERAPIPRDIINQFENAHCDNCTHSIPKGALVKWIGRGKILCQDCSVELGSDKALVQKDVKLRDGKQLMKAYEHQTDELFYEFVLIRDGLKFGKSASASNLKKDQLVKIVTSFLQGHVGSQDEEQKMSEVLQTLEDCEKTNDDADTLLSKIYELLPKARKRRQRTEQPSEESHENQQDEIRDKYETKN